MKYIKTFENIQKEPKVGDYVLCEDSDNEDVIELSDWNEYIRTHIGKVIQIKPGTDLRSKIYVVKYKDVPNYIQKHFHYMMDDEGNFIYHDRRGFYIEEIKFCSPSKKKVELMMKANKFNI